MKPYIATNQIILRPFVVLKQVFGPVEKIKVQITQLPQLLKSSLLLGFLKTFKIDKHFAVFCN